MAQIDDEHVSYSKKANNKDGCYSRCVKKIKYTFDLNQEIQEME